MITQEEIYRFFQTLHIKFLNGNIPILNNLIHDYEDYPYKDDVENNYITEEKDNDNSVCSDEEN
tara:strand:- start:140 stop:331 length:192 start_codon:yes stop_codon:yes gene_type:complete